MRLSKSQVARTLPYPLRTEAGAGYPELREERGDAGPLALESARSPSLRATADLIDLVADRRSDLMKTLLSVLEESRSAHGDAEELMALVAACGLTEAESPCATAMAIHGDLEKLAGALDRWTHPAQIVKKPDSQALFRLCAARIKSESGSARGRLERILRRFSVPPG